MSRPLSNEMRLWRSLQIFNAYRLVQMVLLALMVYFSVDTITRHSFDVHRVIVFIGIVHTVFVAGGYLLSCRWRQRFQLQLSAQVALDVVCISLLMFCADGARSGFSGMVLITVAGASLMSSRRLTFFYAAMGAIGLQCVTVSYDLLNHSFETSDLAYTGFLSLALFVAAYVAHLIGRRLNSNEELAWQRGVALDDQMRVSRRVMEHMNDGVLVIDAEGHIVDRNPMAQAILGYNPKKSLLELIDADLTRDYHAWRQGGAAEVEIHRPDGIDIAVSFAYTYSSSGVALAFLRDLSKLREQAQHFKLVSLGRMAASIAHEIRNPLSSIRHAGELLSEDARDPAQQRLLRIIGDNVRRLDRIVQDVLVLGRQRAETQEAIALAVFFREFIPELEEQENLPSGMIVYDVPEAIQLLFNPEQFRQVLWNLLGNALRYASRNIGSIHFEAVQEEDGVALHLTDDGAGIPNELQTQIFEPFFTTSSKGTGLGLHIARELCTANGAVLFLAPGEKGGHFVLKGKDASWSLQEPA